MKNQKNSEQLSAILKTLAYFLKDRSVAPWGEIIQTLSNECIALIDQGGIDSLEDQSIFFLKKVRKLLGGMGSLNDLNLHRNRGHILPEGENEANRILDQLRQELYEAVTAFGELV